MRTAVLLLAFTSVPTAVLGDQYLCTADLATGFSYDVPNKQWKRTNFIADSKYVVSPSGTESAYYELSDNAYYEVKVIGEADPEWWCKNDFNEAAFLHCEGVGGEFKFNKKSGRYIRSRLFGYFNVVPGVNNITDASSDTPNLEIGKCSPF